MDTAQLKAFLRIAETGSISRAAESFGIAQPSLSQQLLRLEDEVGAQLFHRTARGVTLTDAGQVFRERARQVLHAADQAMADARNLRDEAQGEVVFAMPPSIVRLIGAELVMELARTAPMVKVRVVEGFTGSIRGWIESEKIDLGMLQDMGPLRHLIMQDLASDELVVVGPRGRLGGAGEVDLAGLREEPWIVAGRPHGLRQAFDAEVSWRGLALRVVQEVDSPTVTIELVKAGMGLALLPHCAVAGEVDVASLSGGGLWRRLALVRNPAHVLTHASVAVAQATRVVMARLIDRGAWRARMGQD